MRIETKIPFEIATKCKYISFLIISDRFHVSMLTQSVGNRRYFHETLVLKLNLVKKLKAMNISYPENSGDYDEEFIHLLMSAVFSLEELKAYSEENNLRSLAKEKYQFVKSNI